MALALGLAATLVGAPAAAPPRVDLKWQGDGCDEADRTAARLGELLPPGEIGPGGTALVQITPGSAPSSGADAQWIATIEIETEGTTVTRTLRGGPCSSLADAIALVVAVTVDPLGASTRIDPLPSARPSDELGDPTAEGTIPEPGAPASEPAALDPTETDPSPTRDPGRVRALRDDARPAPRGPSRSRPPISTALIAEGGGAIGLLPRVGGRVGGTFVLGLGDSRIALTGLHVLARRVSHPDDQDSGAAIALSAARLSGGWSFRAGRFTFPLCAGIEAGAFTAAGFGLQDTTTARAAWVAIVPHAQPTLWATRWLGVGVHLEAPIAVTRPRFAIDDFPDTDLVRVGPVGMRFGLSIEVRFFDESAPARRRARGSG